MALPPCSQNYYFVLVLVISLHNIDFLHFVTSKQIQLALDIFDQELASYSPGSKCGPPPVPVINKVLFALSQHICLHIVCGCFVLP